MQAGARPFPVLGTAMWGWTLAQTRCSDIADAFYDRGGRWFDTAANYPIDGNPDHFGLGDIWLSRWMEGRADTKVIAKIGAVANDGRPEHDLSATAIESAHRRLQSLFGRNLAIVCVHWDNRDNAGAIAETVDALQKLRDKGLDVGLAGIRRPDLYYEASVALRNKWHIQIKNNALTQEGYGHYRLFHGARRFHVYGLNAGGVKLDGSPSRTLKARRAAPSRAELGFAARLAHAATEALDRPIDMNALGILLACSNEDVEAILLGPSRTDQLFDALAFLDQIDRGLLDAFAEARRGIR